MQDPVQIVRAFYNQSTEIEWGRIDGRPEFLLTCRYLERYIQPGDRVLDIGGGPGRYSLHLARRGCDVTLVDLSEANADFAAERAKEQNLTLRTLQGDAREVDGLVDGLFDHVLLMGPLYHLLEERDRVRAVEAAMRVLKPGGVLFASFISMGGGLVYGLKIDPATLISDKPSEVLFLKALTEGRSYAGDAFTKAFFIHQREVLPFFAPFGLEKLHLLGQESVLSPNEDKVMSQSPEVVAAWLDLAEKLCEKEEYLSWAEHLMYIGRKRG